MPDVRENWIRLDSDFQLDEWLLLLPKPTRWAWIDIVLHVAREGSWSGCAKRRSTAVLAKHLDWPVEVIEQALAAAEAAGEIAYRDDVMVIVGFDRFRKPDTLRKRKQRPGTSRNVPETSETAPERPGASGVVPDGTGPTQDRPGFPVARDIDIDSNTPPPTDKSYGGGVARKARAAPPPLDPWWEEHPDELAAWIGRSLAEVPKYAKASRPPTRERVERLTARLRSAAPSESVIRDFVTEWCEFHSADTKARYGKDDPVASITDRIATKEPIWASIKARASSNGAAPKRPSERAPLLDESELEDRI